MQKQIFIKKTQIRAHQVLIRILNFVEISAGNKFWHKSKKYEVFSKFKILLYFLWIFEKCKFWVFFFETKSPIFGVQLLNFHHMCVIPDNLLPLIDKKKLFFVHKKNLNFLTWKSCVSERHTFFTRLCLPPTFYTTFNFISKFCICALFRILGYTEITTIMSFSSYS